MKRFMLLLLLSVTLFVTGTGSILANSSDKNSYTYYGYYPQSILEDDIIYDALYFDSLENLPELLNWYKYNNEYYAKVETSNIQENTYFSNGIEVLNNRVYFFKVEKIKWNIVRNNDYYELSAVNIIDAESYYDEEYDKASFFENSNINLLLQDYVLKALDYSNLDLLEYTTDHSSVYRESTEMYSSKVHIPTYTQSMDKNQELVKAATDYAIARGAVVQDNGYSDYWLGMLGNNNKYAIYTTVLGQTFYNKGINEILGIAPAIRVKRGVA